MRIEKGVELLGGDHVLLDENIPDVSALGESAFRDFCASRIADLRAEGGDYTYATLHLVKAAVLVYRYALDAVLGEYLYSVSEHLEVFKEAVEDDRLECVQLELSRLGSHSDGGIVSDNVERNLVNNLGDDGIYLAWHDGGAVLLGREIDLTEACARSGGHKAEVIRHLREVDGAGLDYSRDEDEAVEVLRRVDEVVRLVKLDACDLRYILDYVRDVGGLGVDARADGGAAHIEGGEFLSRKTEALEPPILILPERRVVLSDTNLAKSASRSSMSIAYLTYSLPISVKAIGLVERSKIGVPSFSSIRFTDADSEG